MIITILVLLATVAMFIIGKIRADGFALRHIFHHIVADNVYQQHCNGSADGTYSHECRHGTQCKSVGIPLCSNSWCQHVFCLTVFHTSQCACHASRRLYLWRLCQGGFALTDNNGNCHDYSSSSPLSFIRPGDRVPWSRFLFGFDNKKWLMVIITTIQV